MIDVFASPNLLSRFADSSQQLIAIAGTLWFAALRFIRVHP